MSAITTTEEHILAFAKYARNSDDKTIVQASDSLLLLFEANKNKMDLNGNNAFEKLYFQEIERSGNEGETFSKLNNYQIFTEFSNCYDKLKNSSLDEEQATEEFKDKVETIKGFEANFAELEKEFSINCELKDEKETLKAEIAELQRGFTQPEPIKFDDLFGNFTLKIQPQEMVNFINDKEQTEFPFKSQDTLKNPAFIHSFYKEMLGKSNFEIQDMIKKVKDKNRALEREINEFKAQKTALLVELNQALTANQTLSTVNQNKEEILSAELAMDTAQNVETKTEQPDDNSIPDWQKEMLKVQEDQDEKNNKKRLRR
ncbi:hypothetical protein CFVI97532_07020 [Campylobacter fetus subsp. venerealis cfvi97/532]|nr:hypothetical protein CFVI97532_07020 [Campylobacter fetus subsp. venerealis cfvi97/532]